MHSIKNRWSSTWYWLASVKWIHPFAVTLHGPTSTASVIRFKSKKSVQFINHFYSLGVNVKTGEIFQATFPDKGPELALRSARLLTSSTHVFISFNHQMCTFLTFASLTRFSVNGCVWLHPGSNENRTIPLSSIAWYRLVAGAGICRHK